MKVTAIAIAVILISFLATAKITMHREAQYAGQSSDAKRSAGPWYPKKLATGHVKLAGAASISQPTNLTGTLVITDPHIAPLVISTYEIDGNGSNGPAGSIQPGVAIWNVVRGAVARGQINMPPNGNFDVATSWAGHDAPYVADLGTGGIMVVYGAISTYTAFKPPAANACLQEFYCMPFKIASAEGTSAATLLNALASSAEYHLPSIGLSEASSASQGDTTAIFGQEQTSSPYGQAGTQGYVAYHATGPSKGYFDTVGGSWDFHEPLASARDGLQTITLAPKDNAYFEFTVLSVDPSLPGGKISISVNGFECALTGSFGASPSEVAENYVRYFNESGDAGCARLRKTLRAVHPVYDPNAAQGGSSIGFDVKEGDVQSLPAPPTAGRGLYCDGQAIRCGILQRPTPNSTLDLRNPTFGGHRHFLYGGLLHLAKYYYALMDVQQVEQSWYGAGASSLATALSCFRSTGPQQAIWTWTDCSGHNPFEVAPGLRAAFRLGTGARSSSSPASPYLIEPPVSGYPHSMVPFVYDYSMEAQPQYTRIHGGARYFPIISAETAVLDKSRNLWIAYQCFDTSGNISICYLEYDGTNGKTNRIGFVDEPESGGSLAALGFLKDVSRGFVLGALVGNGPKWGCPSGPCAIEYRLRPGMHSWEKSILHSFGGSNFAKSPGVVAQSPDGLHLLFQSEYNDAGDQSVGVYDDYYEPEKDK
jgi:hypothetical protein